MKNYFFVLAACVICLFLGVVVQKEHARHVVPPAPVADGFWYCSKLIANPIVGGCFVDKDSCEQNMSKYNSYGGYGYDYKNPHTACFPQTYASVFFFHSAMQDAWKFGPTVSTRSCELFQEITSENTDNSQISKCETLTLEQARQVILTLNK